MKLGDKVKFQKVLKKGSNRKTEETKQFMKDNKIEGYPNWGVVDIETLLEGVICGKRNIDMNGGANGYEGYYEFGQTLSVYLVATKMSGFHRVHESFIVKEGE